MSEWLKPTLVGMAGGALTGGLAAALDPTHFNFRDWPDEKHIATMAVEGACVALGGMIVGPLFKGVRNAAQKRDIESDR